MKSFTLSRPATRRVSQLCRKCAEFAAVYRIHRRCAHPRLFCLRMALTVFK